MKQHNLNPKDFKLDEIISIELIGERDTVDISVEDTHMFYANDVYTHNSGLSADVIEEDSIAGSYGKIMESYFVMTLSRNVDDKQGGTARIFVAKNRFGPDGLTFPSKFNASNGRILIYEKDSVEGKKVSKDLEEDVTTRVELRDRFNELMNKKEKPDGDKIDLG